MTASGAVETGPLVFSEVHRTLSLFVHGLTGRTLHLEPLQVKGLNDHFKRILAAGERIYLPAEVADFASRRHNIGVYRVAALRQIACLEHGSFEFSLNLASIRMPASSIPALDRALAHGEALRKLGKPASDLALFFASASRPALLRRIFVILEALRIDAIVRRCYPGAVGDLDRVLRYALSRRPSLDDLRPLNALIEALVQFSLGAERTILEAHDGTDVQAFILDAAAIVQDEAATVYDSAHAALGIFAWIEALIQSPARRYKVFKTADAPPAPSAALLDETCIATHDPSHSPPMVTAEEMDVGSTEFNGTLMPDFAAPHQHTGLIATPLQELLLSAQLTAHEGEDRPEASGPESARALPRAPHGGAGSHRSFLYDEWAYNERTYLKAWCRVYEHRLRGDDFDFIDEVRGRHPFLANQIRQQFGFFKSTSRHRVHRMSDGEELDFDGMIEAITDHRAGHATDAHLYIWRDLIQRSVCAAFLVDMSASTDFPLPDPSPMPLVTDTDPDEDQLYLYGGPPVSLSSEAAPRRRVIDVAKDALALMGDALRALGDSHAIYGFSGEGRDNVEFHIAKDFGDPWSARTMAALAAIQPRRSTRTGPAIRHAMAKLARQPEQTKVLIVVSDGYPEDRDYGPDPNDVEYGIQDTARALQEAERAGLSTFCIAIDPAGQDYLRRMCAESSYLVIDDVEALPSQLTKVYRTLTPNR